MGAQHVGVVDIEGVVHGPGGMMRRNVERFEVVIVVFNFGAFDYLETQRSKIICHALNGAGDRVQRAQVFAPTRQGHIERLS